MGGASGVSGCQGVRPARRKTQEEEPGGGVRANLRGQGYLGSGIFSFRRLEGEFMERLGGVMI